MKITMSYNPYNQTVILKDNEGSCLTPRLSEFLKGSMDRWLDYQTVSYQYWNGLLPELMMELNDDALEITFQGVREDYQRIEEALRRQSENVEEYGYRGDSWTLCFREHLAPEQVLKRMRLIASENEFFRSPSQEVAEKRNFSRRELEQCQSTVEQVVAVRRKWLEMFELAANSSETEADRNFWLGEIDRMNQIFEE